VKRRSVALVVAAVACGATGPLLAQRRATVGVLSSFPPSTAGAAPLWAAFHAELESHGWVEGRNLTIVGRYAEGKEERQAGYAGELVAAGVDVIVATNSRAVDALRKATATIPIVMVNVSHAVEVGFVASLARPGGNVTGVVNQAGDMQGKFIELLRSVRPELKTLGIVWSPNNRGSALAFKDAQAVAQGAGVRLLSLPADRSADIEPLLAAAQREGVQALIVHPTPPIGLAWRRIQAWAIEHKVITLGQAQWVRGGFLMSYWADTPELFRAAAKLVDRILRGAKPADLPVQQPTQFELVVNLKTAKALGIKIPQSLLLRANEVIQ
jgi:putative tryptophan/tyrosine transport system substrate-binding protein